MKALLISCATLLVLFSCKKREEIPVKPKPEIADIKIIKIKDSTIYENHKDVNIKRFVYDEAGLIKKIGLDNYSYNEFSRDLKSPNKNKSISHYIYSNGWLSKIEVDINDNNNQISKRVTPIVRNEMNQIINIQYGNVQSISLHYNTQNLSSEIINFYDIKDTIYYKQHFGARWVTLEHKKPIFMFDEEIDNMEILLKETQTRNIDTEGRINSINVHIEKKKINRSENGSIVYEDLDKYTYNVTNNYPVFDSPALSAFRVKRNNLVSQHYSPNIDAGEELRILPPNLDALISNEGTLFKGENISFKSTVSDLNSFGLPRKIVITAEGMPEYFKLIEITYDSE